MIPDLNIFTGEYVNDIVLGSFSFSVESDNQRSVRFLIAALEGLIPSIPLNTMSHTETRHNKHIVKRFPISIRMRYF